MTWFFLTLKGLRVYAYRGDEGVYRDFFKEYVKLLARREEWTNILIDSTGLPDSIHFSLTGHLNISNEMRLISILQQETELPLFIRYCPGNVIDVTILTKTILELKANGIWTKFAILDAGYLTKENPRLYKDELSEHPPILQAKENPVSCNCRYASIMRIYRKIGEGHRAYVYLCQVLAMKSIENSKLFDKAEKAGMNTQDVFDAMSGHGIFMLVLSRPIAKEKLLNTYYTRQQIEQIFDLCKNYTNRLPLRVVQSEQALRGHLMLSFIAAAIIKMLQKQLKDTSYSPC